MTTNCEETVIEKTIYNTRGKPYAQLNNNLSIIVNDDILRLLKLSTSITPKKTTGPVRVDYPVEHDMWKCLTLFIDEHNSYSVRKEYFKNNDIDSWMEEKTNIEQWRRHVMRVVNELVDSNMFNSN